MLNANHLYCMFCMTFVVVLMFSESIPQTAVDRAFRPFADYFYLHVASLLPLAYVVCAAYVACVYLVKPQTPYDLRGWLAGWSFSLAAFSVYGAMRLVPVLARMITVHGVFQTICGDDGHYFFGDTFTWGVLFVFSKLPELLDTAFIVLRKKPLIFLHYYHHVTVLLYTWHALAMPRQTSLIFAAMNYMVHAFMYMFYGFVALGARPSWFARYITTLQIAQMVIGTVSSLYTMANVHECRVRWEFAVGSVVMYASYLLLFVRFYVETYCEGRQKTD